VTFVHLKNKASLCTTRAAGAWLCDPARSRERTAARPHVISADRELKTRVGWAAAEADLPPDLASGQLQPVSGTAPLPPLPL
jgi:hypothetical protein